MLYGRQKRREHIAIIRQIMVRYPNATIEQIGELVKTVPDYQEKTFSKVYINKLQSLIHAERAARYDEQTKALVVASFEDFINDIEPRLRSIMNNKNDSRASVVAAKQLVENRKQLIEMAMDVGLLERKLGSVDLVHYDVATISRLVEQKLIEKKDGPREISQGVVVS